MSTSLRDFLHSVNDPTQTRTALSLNDELYLFLQNPHGISGGSGGFSLQKSFNTIQARNLYYKSNPSELQKLKDNPLSLVAVADKLYRYYNDAFISFGGTTTVTKEVSDGQAITHVSINGNTITFTHGDGAKHSVLLPTDNALKTELTKAETNLKAQGVDVASIKAQLGELKHKLQDFPTVYTYRGTTAPQVYPSDPRSAYFINLHNSTATVALPIPTTSPAIPDGTVYFVNNENSTNKVTVTPASGDAIDNAVSKDVAPQSFLMIVKEGKNWVIAATGYIPSSLQDLINRVIADPHVANGLHTDAELSQLFNNYLANPATQRTIIDFVNKHSGGTRPNDFNIHYGIGDDYPRDFNNQTGETTSHKPMVINGLSGNPSKVWVAVPKSQSSKVSGIRANNGLAAQWDSQDLSVKGEDYTVFLSPTQLADDTLSLTILWSV